MRKFKDTTLGIKKPSAWRLDGAMRRAAMTLAAVILTTITAWAQSAIGSIQYNSTGGYYEINSTDNLDDLAVYVNGTGTYSTDVVETTAHDCSGLTFKMTANITYTHTTDWNDASSTENNFTAIGYTKEIRVGRIWNDLRGYEFGGGTNEVMDYIAGRQLVKKYRKA